MFHSAQVAKQRQALSLARESEVCVPCLARFEAMTCDSDHRLEGLAMSV